MTADDFAAALKTVPPSMARGAEPELLPGKGPASACGASATLFCFHAVRQHAFVLSAAHML